MKEILLTQGKVALVDDEDFEKLNRYKWYAMQTKQNWYSVRNIRINNKQTLVCMHREIINAPINKQVDHINGNGLDNQKRIYGFAHINKINTIREIQTKTIN